MRELIKIGDLSKKMEQEPTRLDVKSHESLTED